MSHSEPPPSLLRDKSFYGLTLTQFLGAFNDNLFKQLVLLLCVDYIAQTGTDRQPTALALFAIPFVLFSGFAGWFSDRNSKRGIVIGCKMAEIVVMASGMIAFLAGMGTPVRQLDYLFIVLFMMSTQSAFFGPGKYGILPELFRERDLPQINGIFQMTTFVAIIFGMALAGFAKDWFGGRLWIVSAMCVGIAVLGTGTSLFTRRTPIAHPNLEFRWSALAINGETWRMLRRDRTLFGVLLVSSVFWFLGGVVQPAVNAFGKTQLQLNDSRTSMLAACMGIGIAAGCLVSGAASRHRVNFRLTTVGAWGVVLMLSLIAVLGIDQEYREPTDLKPEPFLSLFATKTNVELACRVVLTGLGFFAGVFIVPLQVFMQTRPPQHQKGQVIGAMNLINWIGIVMSAVYLQLALVTLKAIGLPPSWTFASLAVVMLPLALFYRPRETESAV